jgi:hypothetical protein
VRSRDATIDWLGITADCPKKRTRNVSDQYGAPQQAAVTEDGEADLPDLPAWKTKKQHRDTQSIERWEKALTKVAWIAASTDILWEVHSLLPQPSRQAAIAQMFTQ